jgi:site-specific DNA recombinase
MPLMPNSEFFRPVFDELAVNGCIGSPTGQTAYAYIRVSGDEQADEGRSGLPRQIAHIHEAALKHGYKIPWELVFADDYSGFEFEERPELKELRRELRSPTRRAAVVVMEHLDRMSRNADWHQGFLLDEMKRLGVQPVFWKEFYSRIERVVLGAIAQEGMEEEKRRMMEGNLHKARSGRVTARSAAYGYKLVDGNGNEGLSAKKDTYYAIREDEAAIVRLIYQRVLCGDPMRKIANDLEMAGIAPPKQYKHWEATQVRLFIRNENYKGDFYAHRWEHKMVQKPAKDGVSTRAVKCKVERPRDEWIYVPVPAIVSADEWEAANRMLDQNRKTARRNAKEPYLLTGLVRCAQCGYTYTGTTSRRSKGKPRKTNYRGYRCPNNGVRPKYIAVQHECDNAPISCAVLDTAVWNIVCRALLEPSVLIDALDGDATSERNRQIEDQIAFLEREFTSKADDDEKLLRAYMAGAFDEHEYAGRRKLLKEETARIGNELARLRSNVLTPEQLEQRKGTVLALSEQAKAQNIPIDPPFELKQRIIKMIVDQIVLDVQEGTLTLEGAVRGFFPIESNHMDKGSWRQLKQNLLGTSAFHSRG